MQESVKYPARFEDASHALVLKTYRGDGYLFEGGCAIMRLRNVPGEEKLVTIASPLGKATFTFTVREKDGKESGRIIQEARMGSRNAKEFHVIPYNMGKNHVS